MCILKVIYFLQLLLIFLFWLKHLYQFFCHLHCSYVFTTVLSHVYIFYIFILILIFFYFSNFTHIIIIVLYLLDHLKCMLEILVFHPIFPIPVQIGITSKFLICYLTDSFYDWHYLIRINHSEVHLLIMTLLRTPLVNKM